MRADALSRAWARLWFASYDPLPAAAMRIALGLLIMTSYVALYPSWETYYHRYWNQLPGEPLTDAWTIFPWVTRLVPLRALWWLGFLASLSFVVGWRTRVSTIVLYVLQASMIHQSRPATNGEDLIFRLALLYGCFAPLGARWSVDAWRRRREAPQTHEVWPVRLMQIHVALIYVCTQCGKLFSDEAWRNGDALYYTMINRTWSAWPWPEMFYREWVSRPATVLSLSAELLFPLLVWSRAMRPITMVLLTAIHIGIAVTLRGVELFSLSMPCVLLVFLSAEEVRALCRLSRRLAASLWRAPWAALFPSLSVRRRSVCTDEARYVERSSSAALPSSLPSAVAAAPSARRTPPRP